ncbi:YadA-like family protein [Burkholderia sp. 9777_1386]|uniref:YadA-like family protein n=1 Tax=Burkholderia sp. 9777_1386 TaxID=2751183 RepID=UPI0018C38F71|nr:YadA-like family protein [Burkholderia sp. 9777_1386]MBG0870785.1 YadA-like family protein [Burkholderia sp. 9777_1386]
MNKTYRSIWNAVTNTWAAAAETAKSNSKGSSRAARQAVIALALGGAAIGGAVAAEVCTTNDGESGMIDTAGVCNPSAVGALGTMGAVGTMAAIDDTYIKIGTSSGANAAQAAASSIAVGANTSASGTYSTAFGNNTLASGNNSTAIGFTATSTGGASVAFGGIASADHASALGYGATASHKESAAVGTGSATDRENSVSVGSSALRRQITNVAAGTQDTDAVNLGQMNAELSKKVDNAYVKVNGTVEATATVAGAIAIGNNAHADATGAAYAATAIGNNANAIGNALAVGASSNAVSRGVAIGGGASASANRTTALGYLTKATAENAVAIGGSASAQDVNSVALGVSSTTDRENSVSVGSAALQRQITNMAAGTKSTDAVNVSQLEPVVAALGGSAAIDPTTGIVTGPTYTLANGGSQTTIGGALGALDTALTTTNGNVTALTGRMDTAESDIGDLQAAVGSGSVGLVQQADAGANLTVGKDTDGAAVNFTGTAGARKLAGVATGDVSATSTEAVNGSQLHGASESVASAIGGGTVVNPDGSISAPSFTVGDGSGGTKVVNSVGDAVTNLDGRVTVNEGAITKLANEVGSGTLGLVQQASAGDDLTVGRSTDGAAVNFTGTAGARKLAGVAAGDVSATSNEVVIGSQLHGVSGSVASAIGGGATVNPDGSVSAPSFTVGDGSGGTKIVNSVGDAVTNLDSRTTINEGSITNLATQIGNGTLGLVQQDPTTGAISVGAASSGAVVNFAGTGGARVLSGVANGVADDDVVTVSQLRATGLIDYTGKEVGAVTYDSGLSFDSVTFAGTNGTKLMRVAAGDISATSMDAINGSQLYALQEEFAKQYGDLSGRVGELEAGNSGGGGGAPGIGGPGTGGPGSIVVGDGADASGSNSSAIGQGAVASGNNGSAIGQGAVASGSNGTAIGQGAVASGDNSTAVGQNAKASGNNSVALGAGSVADRDNAVSVGSAGNERQITNVAAGTAPTDAVNVQQLNDNINSVRSEIDSNRRDAAGGTASAVAIANLPQASLPGESMVSVAGGTYSGESAAAFGVSTATRNGKWVIKASGSTNTRGTVAVGAGVGYRW